MRRILIVLSLLLLGVGCVSATVEVPVTEQQQEDPAVILPNGNTVQVELADTYGKRLKGLSGQTELAEDAGLLFLHETADLHRYWMKDMLIPIDIIWIDQDRIVGFVEHAQPESPAITIYQPPVPVDKVLEVSAGFVEKNGLQVGDILDIQGISE